MYINYPACAAACAEDSVEDPPPSTHLAQLSKEEAEGFKNFCNLKPPELDDDTFYKQIFLAGCNVMTQQIMDLVKAHQAAEANKPSEEKPDEQTEEQLQDQ